MRKLRFKQFLRERNQFSKTGDETLLSVSEYYGVKPRAEAFASEEHESRAATLEGYRIVKIDDLVMNYMLAWKGAYGVANHDGIVSPAYSVFKVDQNVVDVRYLHHRVRSDDMKAYFRSRSKGIIESRLRLYPDSLLASFVEIPDLATQRQIADFLDRETARIDLLIEKKQRFKEQLKAKSNAVVERYYSIGLTSDRSFKSTGLPWLPSIPSDWKITAIKRLVPVKDGTHETPEYVEETDEAFPLVTSKDFFGEEIDFSGAKFISSADHHSIYRRSNTETGDILMSMIGGNIGKCLIVKDSRMFSIKNVALFKTCSDQQLAKFVLHYLRSSFFDEQLSLIGRGGAQGFIGLGDIRNLQIPVIPPEEMKTVVSEVEKLTCRASSVINAVQSSIDRLEEYRSALITAAVTGQIDVQTYAKSGTPDRRLDAIQEEMGA